MYKQFKTINEYNFWQADTLSIKSNRYTVGFMSLNIIIYYNPANHIIYCESIDKKETHKTIDSFLGYLDKLNKKYPLNGEERDCYLIKTDYGVEFQNKFEQTLDSYDIEHVAVPANIDHLLLAGINSMCRVVRDYVLKTIDEMTDQKQQLLQEVPIKQILDDFMEYQNTQHNIVEYKKPPIEITEEEVQIRNQIIRQHNSDNPKAQLYSFKVGDIVQIRLKRETFEKKRTQRYSRGLYKIINRYEHYYQLIPENFDQKLYKTTMKSRNYDIPHYLSTPVYFRKGYELKYPKEIEQGKYYPKELENTQFFTFDKIVEALGKTNGGYYQATSIEEFTQCFQMSDRFYRIQIEGDKPYQFIINQKQLRFNKLRMNDAEKVYWFDTTKNPNGQFIYNYKL